VAQSKRDKALSGGRNQKKVTKIAAEKEAQKQKNWLDPVAQSKKDKALAVAGGQKLKKVTKIAVKAQSTLDFPGAEAYGTQIKDFLRRKLHTSLSRAILVNKISDQGTCPRPQAMRIKGVKFKGFLKKLSGIKLAQDSNREFIAWFDSSAGGPARGGSRQTAVTSTASARDAQQLRVARAAQSAADRKNSELRAELAEAEAALRESEAVDQGQCVVCMADCALDDGIVCAGSAGPDEPAPPHFTCAECFGPTVVEMCAVGGALESERTELGVVSPVGAVPCALFGHGCNGGCFAQAFVHRALSAQPDALQTFVAAGSRIAVDVAWQEEDARIAREEAAAGQADLVEQARLRVTDALTCGQSVPCPSCHSTNIKDDACMHMTCSCGCHFCYVCGQDRAGCGRRTRCCSST